MKTSPDLHQNLVQLLGQFGDWIKERSSSYYETVNKLDTGFTIAGLHEILCKLDSHFSELEYKQFRNLLYNNPTNKELEKSGIQFVVVENNGHIDKNIYQLVVTDQRKKFAAADGLDGK